MSMVSREVFALRGVYFIHINDLFLVYCDELFSIIVPSRCDEAASGSHTHIPFS